MDLKISTDLTVIPQTIDFNFEPIRAELEEKLSVYANAVYDENGIIKAKEDRAALNKFVGALDAKRLDIKKMCLAPYNEFEGKIKTLTGMVKQVSSGIDTQIKSFEAAEQEKKYKEISDWYKELDGADGIELDKIIDPKWKNKSLSINKIKAELAEEVKRIVGDREKLTAICENDSTMKAAIMNAYISNGYDLSAAMACKVALDERKKREAEAKAAPAPEPVPEPEPIFAEPEPEKTLTAILKITGTADQIKALGKFLRERGMKYEVVRR